VPVLPPLRARTGAVVLILALALVMGWTAALAHADGDPASDVLASQPLFLPADAGVTVRRDAQLAALLDAAPRSGYPIRVALVASSADLGSITELWGQPQSYAQFLGQELSFVYSGPLLVIMPGGFGLYRFDRPLAVERAALAGIRPAVPGGGLAAAALLAVPRLAAASGHSLPLVSVQLRSSGPATTGTLVWLTLGVGVVLIAAAWSASFRARPLALRRHA